MAYVVNREQVREEPLVKGGARSTKVRYLIDERHGANSFYLRIYEIEPGGQTPHDQHAYEHEVYVLKGRANLLTLMNDVPAKREVREGDVIFIASNQVHQFSNESGETFQMLCVRGAERIGAKTPAEAESGMC